MIEITEISFLEYLAAFLAHRSVFADHCAEEAVNRGVLLCARIGKKYAGYLFASANENELRITYANTLPEYRRKGVFTELAKHITDHSTKPVRVNILQKNEFHDPVVSVCKKLGFLPSESAVVFTCHSGNADRWQEYMDSKGTKLCSYLKRHGYSTVRFADADNALIGQIRNSSQSDFQNPLSPALFMDDPAKQLSTDMSFAAVKDGKLAAYTLVTKQAEKKAVFEHISVSSAERGSGIILLPFAAAMDAFFKNGCESASYAMYGSNTRANAFRKKLLTIFDTTESISENYIYAQR